MIIVHDPVGIQSQHFSDTSWAQTPLNLNSYSWTQLEYL